MVNKKMRFKTFRKKLAKISSSQKLALGLVVALIALAGVFSLLSSHASSATTQLYLSPASQSVTTGSTIAVSVVVNTGGASINTVQSVLSYDPTHFSFVSITPGPDFAAPNGTYQQIFTNSESSGTVQFSTAPPVPQTGTVTPITGIETVVIITLKATATGTSTPITLGSSLCGPGNFTSTCTAAYDATAAQNPNDLLGATTPIVNGSYTVTPIPPAAPTNLTVTGVTSSSESLSWTASTGPGTTGYYIYRDGSQIGTTTGTTYKDTGPAGDGLGEGTSHTYTVAAYDSSTPQGVSGMSNSVTHSTFALPAAPTNVTNVSTETSIALSWTAATDTGGAGGIASYVIYRNSTQIGTSTTASFTDNGITGGLTPNTAYNYTVKAVDIAGNVSAGSQPISAKTLAVIAAPAGLQKTASAATSVSLSWTASSDSRVTGYYIYIAGSKVGSSTGASYTATGLGPGKQYVFTIAAHDAASTPDVSAQSASVSVTTPTVVGDLDGDGHVTGHDLSIFLAHYGTNYPAAEFDGTSTVEGHDLSILLSNYGK